MFYQLPPVGNPVTTTPHSEQSPEACLQSIATGYQPFFYQSGTAALAAAVIAAMAQRPCEQPEVLLPAYACPDLISAVLYAGATPVLVDLEPERPWMSLTHLQDKLGRKTVAVIAVNLFGIAERIEAIQQLAHRVGAMVIEDSAQGFPLAGEQDYWRADTVVVSFGRGKPVSLLGGGAVLSRQPGGLPRREITPVTAMRRASTRFKAGLYNRLIHPRLYWMLLAMPFLHLGETRFHPLPSLAGMDAMRHALLVDNIENYQRAGVEEQQRLNEMIQADGVLKLAEACNTPSTRRLLRYPLLVEPGRREHILAQLNAAGLGASVLYPAILPEIDGLPDSLAMRQGAREAIRSQYPNAVDFAGRLLTLPTHSRVGPRDIAHIGQIINRS